MGSAGSGARIGRRGRHGPDAPRRSSGPRPSSWPCGWPSTATARPARAPRAALWESDVRDATFANVVSDARRAMARLVEPPADEEWIGRTYGEDLPLHPLVTTDAELLGARLRAHATPVGRAGRRDPP